MDPSAIREVHVQAILHAYMQARDHGEQPDRQALFAAHPELREELAAYFADESKLRQLAQALATQHFAPAEKALTLDSLPDATAAPALPRVRYFGDYELLEEIARGGMGVVYKAQQVSLNRTVALKMILKGELATTADVQRFRQEAEAAASLDHPNIVPIYEVGTHDGQQYFSMKLIERGTLKQGHRHAAETLAKVARAVHHAHQRGILHRDLKPSNILIDTQGEPHVADFGLARRVEGGEQVTRSGAIVGTPAFMAPEQAQGVKPLTTAVDVYSLGAIFYEWLTGRPPFEEEDALATLLKVIEREPAAPRAVDPGIPRDLETICLKCLAKEPGRRYASALELAEDLERWLGGDCILARPATWRERSAKWLRRHPAAAALLGVCVLALVGLGAGIAMHNVRINEALLQAQQGKLEAQQKEREAQQRQQEALQRQREAQIEKANAVASLYDSLLREAEALRLARMPGYRVKAWQCLQKARQLDTPAVEAERLRLEAAASLGDFVGLAPTAWPDVANCSAVAACPSSSLLAIGTYDGAICLRHSDTGKDRAWLRQLSTAVQAIAFSPDGKALASHHLGGKVALWQQGQDGAWRHERTLPGASAFLTMVVQSAEQGTVVSQDKEIVVRSLTDGAVRARVQPPVGELLGAALAPDASLLAVVYRHQGENGICIWDVAASTLRHTLQPGLDKIRQVRFSRDGKLLLCGCELGVAVYSTAGFERTLVVRGDVATDIDYHPASQILAFPCRLQGVVRLWNLASNREEVALRFAEAGHWPSVLLSGDGQVVTLRVAGTFQVWNRGAAAEKRVLSSLGEGIPDIAFSPNGKLLAAASKDRSIGIWDVQTGCKQHVLRLPGHAHNVAFSPDGTLLAIGDWGGTMQVWNVGVWQKLAEEQLSQDIWSLAFSPDGHWLASGGTRSVRVWRVQRTEGKITLQPAGTPAQRWVNHVSFSPDSRLLLYEANNPLGLWDVSAARALPLPPIRAHGGTQSSFFLSNDLVVASGPGGIQTWDLRSERQVAQFGGLHFTQQTGIALAWAVLPSPDGRWLAANGNRVTLWDRQRQRLLLALPGERSSVWSLAWSPDRRLLATGTANGELVLWDLPRIRERLAAIGLDWNDADH